MYIVSAFRKIYGMVVFKLFVKQMGFIRNPHCIKDLLMYVDSLDIGAQCCCDRFIHLCRPVCCYCSLSCCNTSKWLIKADLVLFFTVASLLTVIGGAVASCLISGGFVSITVNLVLEKVILY